MPLKTLADQLSEQTRESELYETLENRRLRCLACGHRCPIAAGFAGVCKVRFNRDGNLLVPYEERARLRRVLPGLQRLDSWRVDLTPAIALVIGLAADLVHRLLFGTEKGG